MKNINDNKILINNPRMERNDGIPELIVDINGDTCNISSETKLPFLARNMVSIISPREKLYVVDLSTETETYKPIKDMIYSPRLALICASFIYQFSFGGSPIGEWKTLYDRIPFLFEFDEETGEMFVPE